jgi:hypothetical protein
MQAKLRENKINPLKIEQTLGWIDDYYSGGEINLLNDFLHRRNQVLLVRSPNHVKISARRRPRSGDHADTGAIQVENFQADDLILVVFSRFQRLQRCFGDAKVKANPLLCRVNIVYAPQLDQALPALRLARIEYVYRATPMSFENDLARR